MTKKTATAGAIDEFLDGLDITADPFQRDALDIVARGDSVVVTAPTGAGKTLIAEGAIHLALAAGSRAFYTAPIKALSNQKFADFIERYGSERVGLLTGDNVVNGDAPLIVMTTEVLRNMIYADSRALDNLGVVVLDEVHYLQDRHRGSVWEEIIIHLPLDVPLVNLSATIANSEDFASWVTSRRGRTGLIVESQRPVPLESLYLTKDRHHNGHLALWPVFDDGRNANPQVIKLLRRGRGRYRRFTFPRRLEVAELLAKERLLPAIYFVFSRKGCEQAADIVATAGMGLTTEDERLEIRRRAEQRTGHLSGGDLDVLGYAGWLARIERGVAAHHAGMIPAFKETVEEAFAAGLIKLVFATETLSLGINMPARSVVLERLTKYTGDSHEIIRAGDYTQLTGRAGRRGIDRAGTAVVLHNHDIPFERVAGIAAEGSHGLRSSFQPTYNMALNLVAKYPQDRAEQLLGASFAQFHAKQRRSELEQRIQDRVQEVAQFQAAAECDRGDLWEYIAHQGGRAMDPTTAVRELVRKTSSGDVMRLGDDPDEKWVLLARGWGGDGPKLLLLASSGRTRRVSASELPPPVEILGAMTLPEPVRTRDTGYRRLIGQQLRAWTPTEDDVIVALDGATDDPVAGCPQLSDHLRWLRRAEQSERERRRLAMRLDRSERGVLEQFRSILALLEDRGYTHGWELTEQGERLRYLYNELDLLLAEAVERGVLDNLNPPDLAAVVSMFTFEARPSDITRGWPNALVAERGAAVTVLGDELAAAEEHRRLPEGRPPDAGFAALAHGWTVGSGLEDLFGDDDFAAGDFVRNSRQLLDLLRQVRDSYPRLADTAAEAVRAIDRGIVAAGGGA